MRNRQLAHLTEQLRREQDDRAHRAVAQEQVRIARELHDAVAHHMSVISVQAGLAQYVFDTDPPAARAALDTIAVAGREAQHEMRQLLLVLRLHTTRGDPARPDEGVPGLARLDDLLARVRAAGLPVAVETHGTVRPLPVHLDLCVYRVIQEALTNTLKHAGPARATIELRYGSGVVSVIVTDDGRGAVEGRDAEFGYGLIGMRERARLYGGTLTASTRDTGGYEVALTVPVNTRS